MKCAAQRVRRHLAWAFACYGWPVLSVVLALFSMPLVLADRLLEYVTREWRAPQ